MYQIATFGSWPQSIHDDPEQQKRINSATGSAVSPDSVDSEKQMCFISGSGKNPYIVRLDNCTCNDFQRRGLPCKHIYRLAAELKLIDIPFKTGFSKGQRQKNRMYIDEAVPDIEALSIDAQNELKRILSNHAFAHDECTTLENSPIVDELKSCPMLDSRPAPVTYYLPFLKKPELLVLVDSSTSDAPRPRKSASYDKLRQWIIENDPDLCAPLPQFTQFTVVVNYDLCVRDCYRYLTLKLDREYDPYKEVYTPCDTYFTNDGKCYFHSKDDKVVQALHRYHPEMFRPDGSLVTYKTDDNA